MNNKKSKYIVILVFLGDLISFLISVFLTRSILHNTLSPAEYNNINLAATFLAGLFFFVMYDLYKPQTDRVFNIGLSSALSVAVTSVVLLIAALCLRNESVIAHVWIIRFIVFELVIVSWRTFAATRIKKWGQKTSCLIIEDMENTSRLARKLKYSSNYGREATYYLIDVKSDKELDIILNQKLKDFDQVFIAPSIPNQIRSKIIQRAFALNKNVSVLADLDSVSTMRGNIYQLDDTPVIEKQILHITKLQRLIKRAFDIIVSLIMAIVTSPVWLICAIAIKLDSKGPVFYKQERYTIHKKVFTIYKFRTMVQDAEKTGAQFAEKDDPRITRVGKFLRATRLDELPQLLNVLLGSMSIVGPRPERPVFADEFSKAVKNYDFRFYVKAGMTGYAHVYGKYNTRISDRILMDLIYIINYSILTDIKVLLLTVKIVLLKSAAEGLDEERDAELSSTENERQRRQETLRLLGLTGAEDENINNYTGV